MKLSWSWPLLGKELVEQAARKRTYVVRVVYAGALLAFFAVLSAQFFRGQNLQFLPGRGRMMLEGLVVMQFLGIFLFLPAMMAGAITAEKERDSLALLLLTEMQPWELLWQKYVGRLVPMFTFLLLSLPPMALAYSLGGLEPWRVGASAFVLVLACLQVGALALMCSAFCRTTTAAFLATYFLGAAIYFGPVLVGWVLRKTFSAAFDEDDWLFLFPPYVLFDSHAWDKVLTRSVPLWLSAMAMLLFARGWLVRRAAVPARHWLLGLLRKLDGWFARVNRRFGGIVLTKPRLDLPVDEPVAWRETSKQALGAPQHLLRIFLALEFATVGLGLAILNRTQAWWSGRADELSVILFVVWGLAVITLSVRATNALVAERTHQTLDTLLTTPMDGPEILRQKLRALNRLQYVFAGVILTLVAVEAYWEHATRGHPTRLYLTCSVLAVAIYLPLATWVSVWIGLRMRSRTRTIITALAVLVGWCVVPVLGVAALEVLGFHATTTGRSAYLFLLSPASAVPLTEFGWWAEIERAPADGLPVLLNFLLYGGILGCVRWWCRRNADRYLRRE